MHLDVANTTLKSTADQQKKTIASLITRAEQRTQAITYLTTTLVEEQNKALRYLAETFSALEGLKSEAE